MRGYLRVIKSGQLTPVFIEKKKRNNMLCLFYSHFHKRRHSRLCYGVTMISVAW